MTQEEIFKVWADPSSPWSDWVAPALFTQLHSVGKAPQSETVSKPAWIDLLSPGTALAIDLPGADSVQLAMTLAQFGYRPIPLFNASPTPCEPTSLGLAETSTCKSVIEMRPVMDAIVAATPSLVSMSFPDEAPPAFILDSRRLTSVPHTQHEKVFDNRWMVFPEDFPAASQLRLHGINRILLVQQNRLDPQEDLVRVLIRLQQTGFEIHAIDLTSVEPPKRIVVKSHSVLKMAWFRALRILKLMRGESKTFLSLLNGSSTAG